MQPIQQVTVKATIIEVFMLLTLAAVIGLGINHFSSTGIALVGSWNPSDGIISANAKNHVIKHELEISDIQTVKRIFDQSGAVFVDARPAESFSEGHIKGAVSLPLYQADELIEAFKAAHDLNQLIITYCSGRECSDSHELAEYLIDYGYKRVSIFIDGYPLWEQKGYPIEQQ